MRKFTLIFLSSLIAVCGFSQSVVIQSPASLEGAYNFETGFGAILTDSIWCGDLVLMDDGADPASDGCEQTTMDYTDKIVMIDRGACEFGAKAFMAQEVGAVAVIIVNNQPGGPIPMGGGMFGGMVTIPTVMLSLEDGDIIKPVLAAEPIEVCLGNIIFNNDIGTSNIAVSAPSYGVIPGFHIADGSEEFDFLPIANVTNNGTTDAVDVTVDVNVDFAELGGSASSVYSQSITATAPVVVDSTLAVMFDAFPINNAVNGTYDITYDLSFAEEDESPFDNEITNSFAVVDGVTSRAGWDFENSRPRLSSANTIGGGGTVEFLAGYKFPQATPGLTETVIDSVIFYVTTNDDVNLADLSVSVNLYQWIDIDGNATADDGEFLKVGFGSADLSGVTENFNWTTVPVINTNDGEFGYTVPADTARIFVGLKFQQDDAIPDPQLVFFGFDTRAGFAPLNDNNLFEDSAELPYLVTNTFTGDDFPNLADAGIFATLVSPMASALYVTSKMISNTNDIPALDAEVTMYPNPTSDFLQVNVELPELVEELSYTVSDFTGKVIFTSKVKNIDNHNARFNVSQLAAGIYHMTILTENGVRTESFSVAK